MKTKLAILLFAFVSTAQAQVSMNDVSLLLPIPKTQAELKANYLNASTTLLTGALFPTSKLKLFDWSTTSADVNLTVRANLDRLAVLGIRFDPCFKDQFSDRCRAQIRMIAQPIVFTSGKPDTADTGVHLFYDTTPEKILELIQFAAQYRNQFLGAGSARAPMQVQPVVSQEGITGKFWQAMLPRIINVLNQSTPSRMAFFAVLPSGRAWEFQSFNLSGASSAVIQIPGINDTIQKINNHAPGSSIEFLADSGVLPRSTIGSDQTFDFLNDSVSFKRSGRTPMMLTTLERLENPTAHLPGTIDCLSCHSTSAMKTNFVKTGTPILPNAATFRSVTLPQNSLINIYERNFEGVDFRLFGYRNDKPLIGQRVINESAAIVDSIH